MNLPDIGPTAQAVAAWLTTYTEPLLIGAGAAGALLATVLIWRFLRHGEAHARLGVLAVGLATAFAMEGMYEVARGPLDLGQVGALFFCATFEIVMLHQGTLAAYKLRAIPGADVARHMRMVWIVAGASGVIASTASSSVTEVLLRLATPPLAAGIWYMSLYADRVAGERQPSAWIWTPQRIGVRLGLLKPGTVDDLGEVFRARQVDRMVRLATRLDTGAPWFAARRALRLRRLAARVDAEVLDAVAARYRQGADAQRRILDAPLRQPDAASAIPAVTLSGALTASAPAPAPRQPEPPAVTQPVTRMAALPDAPARRTREVVMRRPVSAPPADRDAAIAAAVERVLTQGIPVRQAARDADVPEATLRRHVERVRAERGDATRVNGAAPNLTMQYH